MKLKAFSITTLLAAMITFCFLTTSAQIQETNPIQQKLLQGKVGNEPLYEVEELSKFYKGRAGKINWTPDQANELIQAINTAKTRGLNPDDYHRKAIQLSNDDPTQRMNQDLLLSDAFMRLARHLSNGKVKPPASWKQKRPPVNAADLLIRALNADDLSLVLYSVEPQNLQYLFMIEALRNYRQIASNGGWSQLPNGSKLLKGSISADVAALRRRLEVSGEYYGNAIDDFVFDDSLDQTVRRFQQTHGLFSDGIVGRLTITELNVPIEKRIQHIEVNL
jgi:murein L,D-transpeptidase YcbB/YkuD